MYYDKKNHIGILVGKSLFGRHETDNVFFNAGTQGDFTSTQRFCLALFSKGRRMHLRYCQLAGKEGGSRYAHSYHKLINILAGRSRCCPEFKRTRNPLIRQKQS